MALSARLLPVQGQLSVNLPRPLGGLLLQAGHCTPHHSQLLTSAPHKQLVVFYHSKYSTKGKALFTSFKDGHHQSYGTTQNRLQRSKQSGKSSLNDLFITVESAVSSTTFDAFLSYVHFTKSQDPSYFG